MKKAKVTIMNKKSLIKFFLKFILPPILIIVCLDIYNYMKVGIMLPLNLDMLVLFLCFFVVTSFCWAMIEALQISFENFLNSDWKGRIVFIIIAAALITLYKISGRI